MSDKPCPFCSLLASRVVDGNDHAFWIRDGFSVWSGHSLIISRRHVASFFAITFEERESLSQLPDQAKLAADAEFEPGGYNVGINDGATAG
jgi:diadenosine tetraphosphate (Ap4A) HIT family hydrolase